MAGGGLSDRPNPGWPFKNFSPLSAFFFFFPLSIISSMVFPFSDAVPVIHSIISSFKDLSPEHAEIKRPLKIEEISLSDSLYLSSPYMEIN